MDAGGCSEAPGKAAWWPRQSKLRLSPYLVPGCGGSGLSHRAPAVRRFPLRSPWSLQGWRSQQSPSDLRYPCQHANLPLRGALPDARCGHQAPPGAWGRGPAPRPHRPCPPPLLPGPQQPLVLARGSRSFPAPPHPFLHGPAPPTGPAPVCDWAQAGVLGFWVDPEGGAAQWETVQEEEKRRRE